ncbi:sigma 54-interacting transcriptional regulator [Pseudomonas fluorescens]|uniref:sigma 54-interacting transcriptional regulator n=1 Tax=Pseudomonas fluorescens TaxID=294 RepID=UPI00177B4C03|nr:sigma 54-interacting transcriptional regulator [Pseudomonas fluorescens]MBD8194192.1 sigma 54-interacting transcriptional regulator [Pseudomonas fluorescens]MBD8228999.1 sigma 54-interacting transcriptional regulator [Pseudomonas fluorescens]MBD8787002.1 sigma 54-interacting transcriptional regulator [Pseudomonas fluorescens]MBD8819164.1 sigma 54-interacting transcriptional regulator [Pseudomonas fluorescens]
MPATFNMENETAISLIEGPDIENTLKNTAALDIDILLLGETGTGKDTLARRIHLLSGRRGNLVAVNCAAIPESLAESQLFGVNSGAYTGAMQSRAGFVEAAHLGTLYLDEIDSMPLGLQAKLLRVLESRGVERLGSTRFIPVDMRVIASAQHSLHRMVEHGTFRRDLYFRLNVVHIQLPPLRDRRERIIPLFLEMIQQEADHFNCSAPPPSDGLLQQLLCHPWLGNVRELRSTAKRFVLGLTPLSTPMNSLVDTKTNLKARLQQIEKALIEESLCRHQYCVDAVALELGIAKRTLYYRIKQLDITSGSAEIENIQKHID